MSDDPASKDGLRWEIRQRLVERLRIQWDVMGEMANQQRSEAAMQISTMMDEIEAWRQAMQKAERDLAALRDQLEVEESAVNHLHTDRNNLRLEIERLRAERDAARQWICRELETLMSSPQEIAEANGWDCFKEQA